MEFTRITSIQDPLFAQMHKLMQEIFPPEEVLDFPLWAEPLEDPGIRVFVAVNDGQVVGATEYRYYEDWNVAMTDFTIIGREGLGIGAFWRIIASVTCNSSLLPTANRYSACLPKFTIPTCLRIMRLAVSNRWIPMCAAKCCLIWGISVWTFRMFIHPGKATVRL